MEEEEVYTFEKNSQEQVRILRREYHGLPLFDLRVFFRDGTEWKPSKKGLCLGIDRLDQLQAGLEALRKTLDE